MRFLVIGLIACFAAPALAQEAPLQRVYGCSAITTAQERLACFDAAVAALRQAEAGGDVSVVSRQQVERVDRENFGLAQRPSVGQSVARAAAPPTPPAASAPAPAASAPAPAPRPPAAPDNVTLKVTSIAQANDRTLTFTMENGQIWRQTDDIRLGRLGDGPWTARIRRAALGTFFLNLDDRTAVRVRRVN
jgi:hypothetical protein